MGMERAWKTEAEGIFIHNGPTSTLAIPHSMIGCEIWHMIQGLRMIDIEAVWNQGLGFDASRTLLLLDHFA
ncbi:hypothetical protein Tco_1124674 [Tanacetum coccineum]|uniref:Uncharacterized protein n=1 Tax=Tanacetum coccineum TaxID=301880 RepID=A0ABQ5J6V5_9ASTR